MSNKLKINKFSEEDIDRIIQMAWEDRTTFDVIEKQFGIKQDGVIRIMRKHMKRKSFEIWRKRTSGRKTKHKSLVEIKLPRFKSSDQK
jgi:uncharacterized protein (TIGR03643 family)|tara:strand:- start:28 stop:291 length:264 start_codon:yes stop_codon:yes gene_type:complete